MAFEPATIESGYLKQTKAGVRFMRTQRKGSNGETGPKGLPKLMVTAPARHEGPPA